MFDDTPVDREATKQLIKAADEHWQGCDWPTSFGPTQIDLAGIRSRQALVAAKATRGEESSVWTAAAMWLTEVERDSARAADLARQAFDAAEQEQWRVASDLLEQAELLETKYGQLDGYQNVREAFQRWFGSRSTAN